MPPQIPVGPFKMLDSASGDGVPLYIVPFDKQGNCQAPLTRRHLIQQAAADRVSDIYLFSHGWNNDFPTALGRYEDFALGFAQMRRRLNLPMPDDYKPMMVGIYWPSTALVFGSEMAPDMAASNGEPSQPQLNNDELAELRELAEVIDPSRVARFYELVQSESLAESGARELAAIILSLPRQPDAELADGEESSPDDIMDLWERADREMTTTAVDDDDFGIAAAVGGVAPAAAGIGDFLRSLDPRTLVRLATVWQMKDRAGTVGANGVGPLLRELLTRTSARVHLIGHSYGAKVVLSATCFGADLPRQVDSMLLLQPAVSHLCFASKVAGANRPGGFHSASDRVRQPILTTFSAHDFPLRRVFHLAVRRNRDLGEVQIAADEPPSKYAALGGYGPRDCGERLIDIQSEADDYTLDSSVGVYGLRGSRVISGHGDVSRPETWWALFALVGRR